MENEKKTLVLDTCVLKPNCEGEHDEIFDSEKWISFLDSAKEYDLGITPFTLFEVFSDCEPRRRETIDYLNKNKIGLLAHNVFNADFHTTIAFDDNLLTRIESIMIGTCIDVLTNVACACAFDLMDKSAKADDDYTEMLNEEAAAIKNKLVSQFCSSNSQLIQCSKFDDRFLGIFMPRYVNVVKNRLFPIFGQLTDDEVISKVIECGKRFYDYHGFVDMPLGDMYLYSKAFEFISKAENCHSPIKYFVDFMNLRVFFMKKEGFLYITRDRNMIELLEKVPNVFRFGRDENIELINRFLKEGDRISKFKEWGK